MLLQVTGFNGCCLKSSARILPPDIGVDCRNLRPDRDDFRVWRAPTTVATVPAGSNAIYRMGRDAPSDATYWLSAAYDADFMPGFLGSDTSERTYFTGGDVPRWTDNTIGLTAAPYPTTSRPLGVPAPVSAPTLAITTAGVGQSSTRYYLVTWVTDKGEESQPSAVSAVLTCNTDAVVQITRTAVVPSDGRVYTYWRIYRTQANASGSASFYYVGQQVAATAVFSEAANTTLGETLPSLYWSMPDANLRGLTPLWNGMAAAFVGKRLCFCEPYRAFAWPTSYELTTKDTIVGLGVWRQNLVVLTTGRNYIVNGSHPSNMQMMPMEFDHACVSKRSIVGMDDCVVWASPIGLVSYGDSGGRVLTDSTVPWDTWRAMVPSTIRAARIHGNIYMGCYTQAGSSKGFQVDMADTRGFYFQDVGFDDLYWDELQDALFVLSGTNVQKWDSGALQPGSFTSKAFRSTRPNKFNWVQVVADSFPVTIDITYTLHRSYQVVNMVTGMSITSAAAVRLPAGNLGVEWTVKVTASDGVQAVYLADSIEELKEVP